MSSVEMPVSTISTDSSRRLNNFWSKALEDAKSLKMSDFRTQDLPLARIKKIMKLDEDVKMISAEAPALFAKASELFIEELTLRAWVLAEENKRRTLQRNDIAMAISKYDQFDFLIDIVPREEIRPSSRRQDDAIVRSSESVQYYVQMPSQPVVSMPQSQVFQSPVQVITASTPSSITNTQASVTVSGADGNPIQLIQLQQPTAGGVVSSQQQGSDALSQQQQTSSTATTTPVAGSSAGSQTLQVFTQVVTPSGEVQQIPLQLTPSQIQAIAQQMQGKQPNQPIVIQTNVGADEETADDVVWTEGDQ